MSRVISALVAYLESGVPGHAGLGRRGLAFRGARSAMCRVVEQPIRVFAVRVQLDTDERARKRVFRFGVS
jgi:hypothetical protein